MGSGPGFGVAALDEWIGGRLPGRGAPLQATRMGEGTGEANALYWLRRGRHVWVLRRPPAVINAPGASDMNREWRILTALEGTAVPHPAPLLLGGTDSPLGTPFLIMERVGGFTPVGVLPAPYDQPDSRRELSFALVDALAELARVPWQARGLDGLGRPAGFLARQVPRWLHQLDSYRTRDIPGLDWIAGWLEANRPRGAQPALMHGDYSPYNVMASPQDTTRLAAVVDWDTGTIGDPLLDIGHLLARWTEPGEEPAIGVWDIEVREGLPTRAELAARYAERTGADLSALPYYQALALFKLAIILEGSVRWDDCDRLIGTVYDHFGRCDVLVSNAGMSPRYPDLAAVSEEYYDKVAGLNLKGPFRLGVLAGTRMAAAGGGSIINISTIGSLRPGPDELVYACAKAGLNALTVGLAGAFGPRVRANAILPGGVLTDIARSWPEEMLRQVSDGVPLGRAGQPADLVGTALWLASRASEWVTGVLVRVDGGHYRQTS